MCLSDEDVVEPSLHFGTVDESRAWRKGPTLFDDGDAKVEHDMREIDIQKMAFQRTALPGRHGTARTFHGVRDAGKNEFITRARQGTHLGKWQTQVGGD